MGGDGRRVEGVLCSHFQRWYIWMDVTHKLNMIDSDLLIFRLSVICFKLHTS